VAQLGARSPVERSFSLALARIGIEASVNQFHDVHSRDKIFKSFILIGGAAICWPIWQTWHGVVFDNVDTKLFCGFFLGDQIGFISRPSCSGVRHRKVGGRGLLQAGEFNNVFLHILGMAFYLQNCVLNRFVSLSLSSWSGFCNKVIRFLFFQNEARCSFHYPIRK
jgi:hypothetical protein